MRKTIIHFVTTLLIGSMLTGCFGKFGLTKKIYQANGSVENKVARSLVTWAFVFIPVYGIAALLDFAIFNTIEFWGGRNPVAQGEKDFEYARGDDTYRIHAEKKDDVIVYTIDHYTGIQFTDSSKYEWNPVTGAVSTGVSPSGINLLAASGI